MTSVRAFFESTMLPDFARRFAPTDLVLNIGAGDHAYREAFPCRLVTADRKPGCDEMFRAEQIPYATDSIDGVLLMGVFERLDDPMQAMREIRRVLRPCGWLLLSVLDLGFEFRKAVDRWRLTSGGFDHVLQGFAIVARHNVEGLAHFAIVQKPAVSNA